MLDMMFTRCTNPYTQSLIDLGVSNGKISYLETHSDNRPVAHEIIDLEGKLLLPGLVESHIHLDKAFLLDRLPNDIISLQDAIAKTAELKHGYTPKDIEERSLQVIEQAIQQGVTKMRCHVEIDPIVKLAGMETTLAIKERLKDVIDLQLVAFPQDGIFNNTQTQELMKQAVSMGADVVGGITYNDRDLHEHLDFVFRLAEKYGKPVDLHVDFSDRPEELAILEVLNLTEQYGMQGQVSVGHLTSLGSVKKSEAQSIAEKIAKNDVHVITLPATDLYLNGRGDDECIRRGLTPVRLLLEQGVNVIYGGNNIQNAFTPFGTADPLDIGFLLAQTCHMGSQNDAEQLIKMGTTLAAEALGFKHYGLEIGADADLIVCNSKSVRSLLFTRPERELVFKKGKLIAKTEVRRVNSLYENPLSLTSQK